MRRHLLVLAATALLATGCASESTAPPASGEPDPSASTSAPELAVNGSVYATDWADDTLLIRYPIRADGSVGAGTTIVSEPGSFDSFPAVVDGLGEAVLTGTFEEYWTADLALRSGQTGEAALTLDAPRWCGGEGLTYNVCVLLDDTRLLRSSELGGPAAADAMISVTSLESGQDIAELGPFPGLTMILGTADPDTVLLVVADGVQGDEPVNLPGTVQQLDLGSGDTTQIGAYADDWIPLCPIGTDSVLGYSFVDAPTASVVGGSEIGEVTWSEEEEPVGCSADGAFLYLQDYPQPPGEEYEDTEPPNPSTTLERISLADGTQDSVLVLDPGVAAGPVTR